MCVCVFAGQTPPQPPWKLTVTQRGGRWRCRPCELQAIGRKQGHYWLALSHHLASSLLHQQMMPWVGEHLIKLVAALPQATPTDALPSYQMTYLPLTAAFMDILSSGPDIINDDCRTEWDIFFKKKNKNTIFYHQQPLPSWNMFCRPCATLFDLTV